MAARNPDPISTTTAEQIFREDPRYNALDVSPHASGGHVVTVEDDPENIRQLVDRQIAGELPDRMRAITPASKGAGRGRHR